MAEIVETLAQKKRVNQIIYRANSRPAVRRIGVRAALKAQWPCRTLRRLKGLCAEPLPDTSSPVGRSRRA